MRIGIIGSGFSGVGLGIALKRGGIDAFTIFEKADTLGGTWRDNTYPGAACDTPSLVYSFSFAPKTDWSRKWAPQTEILAYLEQCADRFDVRRHIRFGTEVAGARFDGEAGHWRLRTRAGEELAFDVLVSSVGQLHRPRLPDIPGLETFEGVAFHSARWSHDDDLTDRTVAVVGTAASAVQLVPAIAPRVRRLYVCQRGAHWMIPKHDRVYDARDHRRLAAHPWLARLARWALWAQYEAVWPVFRGNRLMRALLTRYCLRHLRTSITDPRLQDALVPDYPVGGKRLLISDDYYQTLAAAHVELITDRIARVTKRAIMTDTGRELPVDAIICATGFETTTFLAPMTIEGPGGRTLADAWTDGASAYLGLSVAGFPNLFMMYGPNTNLGHNSIIFMIECQARYIVECVTGMAARGLATLEVRADTQAAYNAQLQRELARTVWAETAGSWYRHRSGRITNNWSGTTVRYWWRTRRVDWRAYHQTPRERSGALGSPRVSATGVRGR